MNRLLTQLLTYPVPTNGGASVAVRPDGRFLAVVERGPNTISTFPVEPNGIPGAIVSTPSLVLGAFSGRFASNGELIVINDAPGTNNTSSISSYSLSIHGKISPVSQSVPTYGNGNCWSAVTPDGQHVYSESSASSTIAGFKLARNGVLDPIGGTIVATLPEESINLEAAVSADGKFLFTLNSGTGTIGIWSIESNGALTAVGEQTGLTPSFGYEGLAAL